jgi:hypothetical protein
VWWVGLISNLLFTSIFFGGLAFILNKMIRGENVTLMAVMLAAIYALGSIKGALRLLAAREAIPQARAAVTRLWWMFCFLWPLVSLIFVYNFLKSATTRRIRWRGVCYEMKSPTETVVISKMS